MTTNEFLQQDVFFFVTTIAVVLLTILISVFVIQLIWVTRKIRKFTDRAQREAELLSADLSDLRGNLRREGFKFSHLLGFGRSLLKKTRKK